MGKTQSASIPETSYNQLSLKDLQFVCFDAQTYNNAFYPFMKHGSPFIPEQWRSILLAYPHMIEVCDKKILKEKHWREILSERPQLAEHCPEKKWTEGIVSWKDVYVPPKNPSGNDIVLDLIFHPVHAEFCKWKKLTADDWHQLLLFHPEFILHCDISRFAPKMCCPDDLLQLQPQWGKYFEIEKLFDPGKFLKKNPEYEKNCKWEKVKHQTWLYIMESNPDLLKYCDIQKYPIVTENIRDGRFHGALAILNFAWMHTSPGFGFQMNKTVHEEICRIIRENPVYLEKWNAYAAAFFQDSPVWHGLGYFLEEYFELYPLCDKKWLTSQDWGHLISLHSELIHDVDLEILTSDAWCEILMLNPTLAGYCNAWEDFSAKKWHHLLRAHREFFPKCPAKNYKKWTEWEWRDLQKAGCPVSGLIPKKFKKKNKH